MLTWLAGLFLISVGINFFGLARTGRRRLQLQRQARELTKANGELTEQKEYLRQSEGHLRRAMDELEVRVEERTLELTNSVRELEKSRQTYEDLVNTIDGIVWESKVGISPYSFVSRQAEKILGYPVERWLSESGFWQRILHPEDLALFTGLHYATPEKKKDRQTEYRVIAADGRVVWMKDFVTVVQENGRPAHLRGIMVDITEHKNVMEELKEAELVALGASKLKSEFLANMSHEIRTPLNAIIGMATLVLDSKLTKSQKSDVDTIQRSADALLGLINDILDFSKIEAGKLELEVLDFDLERLLEDSCGLVTLKADEKKLNLTRRIDANCPRRLRGDSGRLLQILANLLSNSVKFTERGGIEVSVTAGPDSCGRSVTRFEVRDSGIGMSQEIQSLLFRPFSQGDGSMARKYGGTGLGLSICKSLVEMMGGVIGVESRENGGSCFWFEVPLEPARETVSAPGPLPGPARVLTAAPRPSVLRGGSKRILIAEDNAANQKVIKRFLEKLGHRANAVANGMEVVRETERKPYDLIFMDCQMPEMDGYDATREIRLKERNAGKPRTPIIALTAHALSGDRDKCLEAGMDDYITKPVVFSVLEETTEKWSAVAGARSHVTLDQGYFDALESLQMDGMPDIVLEVIEIFERTAPVRLAKMRELLGLGAHGELSREAHAMKSTAGSVGARGLGELCGQLEAQTKAPGTADSLAELLERIADEIQAVQTGLDAMAEKKRCP